MTEAEERTNPQMVADLMAACSRLNDRQPEFTRLVHDLFLKQLKYGPKTTETDPWEHIAQHLKDIARRSLVTRKSVRCCRRFSRNTGACRPPRRRVSASIPMTSPSRVLPLGLRLSLASA